MKKGNLTKALWEHLKTKRKYNTLKLRYETKCIEYDDKVGEMKIERRIHQKEKAIWENKLKEQEEQIIDLKKKIRESRKRKN